MKISPVIYNGLNKIKRTAKEVKNKVKSPASKINKSTLIAIPAALFAGSAIVMYAVQAADIKKNNNTPIIIPYNPQEDSLTNIAKTYNTSESAIKAYNEIANGTQINNRSELKVPKTYDYIGDEITILQTKLYSKDLTPEERTLTENRINLLLKKQQEQNNVADVYTDGTDLYITINIKNEELPDKLKDKYQFGINIESLKKLFDIKDGAIEENNDISAKWVPTSNDGTNGYYDYTLNWFKNGDVIKVPLSSINTEGINLSSYSK